MKTTRKEIYRIYGKENVISLGYCKIQSIEKLSYKGRARRTYRRLGG